MKRRFAGRLGLQQRVLPNYRVPFFDLLAGACKGGLCVFAGKPRLEEGIVTAIPKTARYAEARNTHLFSGVLYLCRQADLIDWLEEWDPQALIVEANARYLSTPAAVRWMHARGRKVIGWGLGAPPLTGILSGPRTARRAQFLRQFDALIAYSRRGAAEYASLGFPNAKIFVATNSALPRPKQPRARPRSRSWRPSVLFVGRLQKRKRVDWLLRACAELREIEPDLVVVGDGPESSALQSLARQIYPRTRFLGAKYGAALDPIFAHADLFVLPGTGGLAVQEAMAHGLPVIVAQGDGTQDDLVRESNGWQVEPDDPRALVEAMRGALSEPARLRKMGAEAYRIISEEINLECMVDTFVQALNAVA